MKVIVMYLKKRPGKVQKGDNPKKGIIGSNNIRTTITEAIDILLGFESEIQNKQNRCNNKERVVDIAVQIQILNIDLSFRTFRIS
jgi:hypothetical protein